jgi:hypothetical protein
MPRRDDARPGLVQRDRDQRPELALRHGPEGEQRHLGDGVATPVLLDRQVADLRAVRHER